MVNFSQELTIAPWVRKTKILLKAGVEPVVSTHKDMSSVLMTVKMRQGTGRRRSNSKRREIYRRWENHNDLYDQKVTILSALISKALETTTPFTILSSGHSKMQNNQQSPLGFGFDLTHFSGKEILLEKERGRLFGSC